MESIWPARPNVPALTGRIADIVDTAQRILERDGWDAVSARSIAAELGIKAPSLYKHVGGMSDVAMHLATRALLVCGDALTGISDPEQLLAAYRRLALSNPNTYRLMTSTEFPRSDLPEGLEDWAGHAFFASAQKDPVRAQALWAFAHGMAVLEIDKRFSPAGSPAEGVWEAGVSLTDG